MAGAFVFGSISPTTARISRAGQRSQVSAPSPAFSRRRCRRCSGPRCGLRAAGRTDTGVHATGQVAHVDVPVDALPNAYPRSPRPTEPEFLPLVRRLGRLLPADVRVRRIVRAPAGFDARFSALRRHYVYRISTASYGVEPHQARYITGWPRAARRGRDDAGIAKPVGITRLCRVLPSPRGCYHHPRPAASGLVPRR